MAAESPLILCLSCPDPHRSRICLVLTHTALEWILEEQFPQPPTEFTREESCQETKEPIEDQERLGSDCGLGMETTQSMSV